MTKIADAHLQHLQSSMQEASSLHPIVVLSCSLSVSMIRSVGIHGFHESLNELFHVLRSLSNDLRHCHYYLLCFFVCHNSQRQADPLPQPLPLYGEGCQLLRTTHALLLCRGELFTTGTYFPIINSHSFPPLRGGGARRAERVCFY